MNEPTTNELAMIAATLAHGRELDPERLAGAALELWNQCERKITRAYLGRQSATITQSKAGDDQLPGKFPVVLDEALALWLPNAKHPDRWHAFRQWLAYSNDRYDRAYGVELHKLGQPKAAPSVIEDYNTLDERKFHTTREGFLKWYRTDRIAESRAAAGRDGAAAREANKAKRKRVKKAG